MGLPAAISLHTHSISAPQGYPAKKLASAKGRAARNTGRVAGSLITNPRACVVSLHMGEEQRSVH